MTGSMEGHESYDLPMYRSRPAVAANNGTYQQPGVRSRSTKSQPSKTLLNNVGQSNLALNSAECKEKSSVALGSESAH